VHKNRYVGHWCSVLPPYLLKSAGDRRYIGWLDGVVVSTGVSAGSLCHVPKSTVVKPVRPLD
jgi:hypothetical protein